MRSLIQILLISCALLQAMDPVPTQIGDTTNMASKLTTDCSAIEGCAKCFESDAKLICFECSPNYIRDTRESSSNQCWKLAPREIIGYGRDCIVCYEGNYPLGGNCYPCPYKCKSCHYDASANGPICDECKPKVANTPGYDLSLDCSCSHGLSIDDNENVKNCFCNDENMFTYVNEDGKLGCYDCDLCYRNFKNCQGKGECPTKTFDPLTCDSCNKVDIESLSKDKIELSICCQDCDITCETCSGPKKEDCITCRNEGDQLFEWVESEKQCMCVCHSKEVVEDGVVKCICNEGRAAKEFTDQVSGKISIQCLCKDGTREADAPNKDGIVECVPL